MTEQDLLQWSDLGRGLMTLCKKIVPISRTITTVALQRRTMRMSLGKVLERSAARHPNLPAVKHERGEMTYRVFNEYTNRIAHYLQKCGVGRGDAVAVFLENRPAFLAVAAAVAKLGGIAGLLNTNQRRHVLEHSIRCFDAKCYVIGEELIDAFAEVRPNLGPIPEEALIYARDLGQRSAPEGYVDLDDVIAALPGDNPASTAEVQLADPCFYILTSGTTGMPKASIMTHNRWLKAAVGFGEMCLELKPGNTIYTPLPMYHNLGLTVAWSSAVYKGAAVALRRHLSIRAFWDDCRRYDATAIAYIGEIPRYLVNRPPDQRDSDNPVRKVIGVGLRPDIWLEFKRRFGIGEVYEIYSASESNTSFLNVMNLDKTVGFCPVRWALVEFDVDAGEPVRNARDRFVRLGRGKTGLLITEVTDRFQFDGYTDSKANQEKLFRNVFRKGDTWFNTGDLMRDIGFGHLQFVDRVGDTFRWKSENVSTGEVEKVVNGLDDVSECSVYGVDIPNAAGRAGMISVVSASESLDMDRLLAHMRSELPSYAVPLFVRITDSLVVTGTFKHRKADLRRQSYDPQQTSDAILVLLPKRDRYELLTAEIYQAIQRGEYSF